jgi:hypothetical protein
MTMKRASTIRIALLGTLVLGALPAVRAAEPATAKVTAPTATAAAMPRPETPFDTASRLYQEGKQAEALVTLQQLA